MFSVIFDKLVPESSNTHLEQRVAAYVNVILSMSIVLVVLILILNADFESRTASTVFILYGISSLLSWIYGRRSAYSVLTR